jgi:hypothetical protein
MPAEYQIDREQKLVRSRAWGVTNKDDLSKHGHNLLADPAFQKDFRQFYDLSEVTKFDVSFSDLVEISKVNVFAPTARRAILAPNNVGFGLVRIFQSLRDAKGESGIRVFSDRAEALRWLETGADAPPPPRPHSANPLRNSPRRA